jgi:hypothetical protein
MRFEAHGLPKVVGVEFFIAPEDDALYLGAFLDDEADGLAAPDVLHPELDIVKIA